ncbi:tachykinin-like peptides receptor 86C [Ischnura elegans]|uniref:tachykinin-like peptides receptor 86C n=1 Tax=Ischnura elegans TaxID=197161 RepID=UPI001ED88238|nr:tachykinin-like peptides receptor 86C [Ischnura elegans]
MHSWMPTPSDGSQDAGAESEVAGTGATATEDAAEASRPQVTAEDHELAWRILYNCMARMLVTRGVPLGGGQGNGSRAGGEWFAEALDSVEDGVLKEAITKCLFPSSSSASSSTSVSRLIPLLAPGATTVQPTHGPWGSRRPFSLPYWQKTAWVIIFSAMLLIAAPGNAIVIWIVLGHRRMRTATNCFLVNLSVSDLLLSILNCAFNLVFMLDGDWPFGAVYCSFSNFVANCSVAASVFSLTAIAVDRYLAIAHPLKHRKSKRRARWVLGGIWSCSSLLALPCLLYSTTRMQWYSNGEARCVCFMLWPDGKFPTSVTEYTYNVIFLGVTYAMPLTVMAVCYSLTGRVLWGGGSIGEMTRRQALAISTKRKVVRMLVLVVGGFGVCWLPYHSYFLYVFHHQRAARASQAQNIYLGFYWLAMANAALNPLIYYCMNDRFRSYFQQVICQCRCFRHQRDRSIMLGFHLKNFHTGQTVLPSEIGRSSRSGRTQD